MSGSSWCWPQVQPPSPIPKLLTLYIHCIITSVAKGRSWLTSTGWVVLFGCLGPLSGYMLFDRCENPVQKSSHIVPTPIAPSLCHYSRYPCLWSSNLSLPRPLTISPSYSSPPIICIYWNLRLCLFLYKVDEQAYCLKLCPLRWFPLIAVSESHPEWKKRPSFINQSLAKTDPRKGLWHWQRQLSSPTANPQRELTIESVVSTF